jgi:hypothetical protein
MEVEASPTERAEKPTFCSRNLRVDLCHCEREVMMAK